MREQEVEILSHLSAIAIDGKFTEYCEISSWWPLPTKAGCLPVKMDQILMHMRINRMSWTTKLVRNPSPTTSAMSSRTSTTCWILKKKRSLVRITVKLSERESITSYEGRRSWNTLSPIMSHCHCCAYKVRSWRRRLKMRSWRRKLVKCHCQCCAYKVGNGMHTIEIAKLQFCPYLILFCWQFCS